MSDLYFQTKPQGAVIKEVDLYAKEAEAYNSCDLVKDHESDAFYFRQLEANGIYLNRAQLAAVRHIDGPFLTLAGAGSGKTLVLVCRAGYLMTVAGVEPENILMVTFTKKAAEEMKDRIAALPGIGPKAARVRASTFHSLFLSMLRTAGDRRRVLSSERIKQLTVKRLMKKTGLEGALEPETLLELFSFYKLNLKKPEDIKADTEQEKQIQALYRAYEDWKNGREQMDFDDILLQAHDLLKTDSRLLESVRNRYKYMMIDEFQDTSPLQFELGRLIAGPEENLFAVGDDDQTIYSFAGANHKLILDFNKEFPRADAVALEVNYRSNSSIVGLGNRLIENNKERRKKELQSAKNTQDLPLFCRPSTTDEEAEMVTRKLQELKSKGHDWHEFAILHRTASHSRAMFEALAVAEIPFINYAMGKLNFYEQKLILPVLDHLRLALNAKYEPAYKSVVPTLYINGERGLEVVRLNESVKPKQEPLMHLRELPGLKPFQKNAINERVKLIRELRELEPVQAIKRVRREFYDKYIDAGDQLSQTLYKETAREALDELEMSAKRFESVSGFIAYVDDMIDRHQRMQELLQKPDQDAVSLMTIHRSKGLEFPVVFLIGASEGMLPHFSSIAVEENGQSGDPGTIEEERRLAYVAVTRAKDELYISSPAFYRGQKTAVSRFFLEAFPGSEIKKGRKKSIKIEKTSGRKKRDRGKTDAAVQELSAWICTRGGCNGWQRPAADDRRDEKTCPLCGGKMIRGKKVIS